MKTNYKARGYEDPCPAKAKATRCHLNCSQQEKPPVCKAEKQVTVLSGLLQPLGKGKRSAVLGGGARNVSKIIHPKEMQLHQVGLPWMRQPVDMSAMLGRWL